MAASSVAERPRRVRDLNDAFRRSFNGGRVVLTAGVAAMPSVTCATLLESMRGFDAFDANNDPHSEHEFGAVTVGDWSCFWKIDCYDRDLRFAPPDPAVTVRVLTVILAGDLYLLPLFRLRRDRGLLIINDGSKICDVGVVVIGLIAWKIARHLERLKDGDG